MKRLMFVVMAVVVTAPAVSAQPFYGVEYGSGREGMRKPFDAVVSIAADKVSKYRTASAARRRKS